MANKRAFVGIDLGTTFSAIAHVNAEGKPEIIPNREGERITPSVVLFDGDTPVVGAMAQQAASSNPLNTVHFVKRQMGDASWKFRSDDGSEYGPEIVSALILKRLKEDAEAFLDAQITDAVISVPAYFNDAQRKATHDAGRIAGLNVLRIINEPTAAALAYGLDNSGTSQTVMVYDLGGGTFDITVMRIEHDEVKVLATGGDKNLGGFDWDNTLMVLLNDRFKAQGGPDLLNDPNLEQDLRQKAEIAKKTLTQRDKARVMLSVGNDRIVLEITRDDFETATKPLLSRTTKVMNLVLGDASLRWSEVEKVLLVGGSTRMPAVAEIITATTGKPPSLELHPDEVVALGAALQAALLQQNATSESLIPVPLVPLMAISDVTSHSLGVIAVDRNTQRPHNSIIVPRNTSVPCRRSELYETLDDNQKEIEVEVTQGEDHDLDYIHIIGKSTLQVPPYPKGAPIEVFLEYDFDAIIHVTVFDRTANTLLGEFPIRRRANLAESEVRMFRDRVIDLAVE